MAGDYIRPTLSMTILVSVPARMDLLSQESLVKPARKSRRLNTAHDSWHTPEGGIGRINQRCAL
jgi:hypothetical protein